MIRKKRLFTILAAMLLALSLLAMPVFADADLTPPEFDQSTFMVEISGGAETAAVKWKKRSAKMSKSHITGYQSQLATNQKFTRNKKLVTVKGYSSNYRKITGLKGGKKYYVHIRTYKKIGDITYYSPWSGYRTVTTGK